MKLVGELLEGGSGVPDQVEAKRVSEGIGFEEPESLDEAELPGELREVGENGLQRKWRDAKGL